VVHRQRSHLRPLAPLPPLSFDCVFGRLDVRPKTPNALPNVVAKTEVYPRDPAPRTIPKRHETSISALFPPLQASAPLFSQWVSTC